MYSRVKCLVSSVDARRTVRHETTTFVCPCMDFTRHFRARLYQTQAVGLCFYSMLPMQALIND